MISRWSGRNVSYPKVRRSWSRSSGMETSADWEGCGQAQQRTSL